MRICSTGALPAARAASAALNGAISRLSIPRTRMTAKKPAALPATKTAAKSTPKAAAKSTRSAKARVRVAHN